MTDDFDPSKFSAPTPDHFKTTSTPQNNLMGATSLSNNDSPWRKIFFIIVILGIIGTGTVSYFTISETSLSSETSSTSSENTETTAPEGSYSFDLNNYTTAASTTVGYQTFIQNDLGFQIDYPDDWTLTPLTSFVPVMFTTPHDENDNLAENVVISLEDISAYGPLTLEDYSTAAQQQLFAASPSYELIDQGKRSLGAYEGTYLLGNYAVDETINAQVLSLFAIIGEGVYVFTYTYDATTPAQYQDVVDTMIQSFKTTKEI